MNLDVASVSESRTVHLPLIMDRQSQESRMVNGLSVSFIAHVLSVAIRLMLNTPSAHTVSAHGISLADLGGASWLHWSTDNQTA